MKEIKGVSTYTVCTDLTQNNMKYNQLLIQIGISCVKYGYRFAFGVWKLRKDPYFKSPWNPWNARKIFLVAIIKPRED